MTAELDLAGSALDRATAALPGAEIEISVDRNRLALTRFANSVIHQNVAEDITERQHPDPPRRPHGSDGGDRDGRRRSGGADRPRRRGGADGARRPGVARSGAAGRRVVRRDPDGRRRRVRHAADRAQVVRGFVDGAGGLETAGYCRTNVWTGAFVNTAGQAASGAAFECGLSGIARHDGADGLARHAPLTLGRARRSGARGAGGGESARVGPSPIELPPGRYEVVLEPTAVADILETLAVAGFNGKAVNEQRSFVRLGEAPVRSVDHARRRPARGRSDVRRPGNAATQAHARGLGHDCWRSPTTAAARPRRVPSRPATPVPAQRCGGRSPATSRSPAATGGRVASPSATARAADSSVADLVAGVERGLLVSDLWYTRLLDPRTLAVTGLTRNGLWLIEDGQVTTPLRNFRFTQSYAQALMPGNVLAVGSAVSPAAGRHLHGDVAALVVPGVAAGVVELHRRRLRLSDGRRHASTIGQLSSNFRPPR